MATTIEVNKSSIKELLMTGIKEKFLIPEYQRPYAWTDEQVITLFDDLKEYTNNQNESSYFLGCIVSFTNENKEQEIIDGQQRITTLLLLLRAIHKKLQKMSNSKEKENFIRQIEPAIWKIDELTSVADYTTVLIESKVMEVKYNQILENILKTGETETGSKDRYSANYNLLVKLLDEYAISETLNFYKFINNVLNKTIVLPIKADTQETALTIFSTLNDRGLPLSDADIFKAKIYNKIDEKDKMDFVDKWKNIALRAENVDESVQKLFYYYMFYLRAIDKDKNTTTPGLRKYFAENSFSRLYKDNLMKNLEDILEFWEVVNCREQKDAKWTSDLEILSILDILSSYPNEFWKYPVIIYYLENKDTENFEEIFLSFLRKLFVNLFRVYVVSPTINSVKASILTLNSSILHDDKLSFEFKKVTEDELKNSLKHLHRNAVRMLLKLLAYNTDGQNELLPYSWEIEHILPVKWQTSYFNSNKDEVNELIETIGNKIPFEKKLNIVASNGYFAKKQEQYKKSNIQIAKAMSDKGIKDWKLEEIRERNIRIIDEVIDTFNSWDSGINDDKNNVLSSQEKAAIELIKSKGLEKYL
ncbi:PF03235 family protein [Peptostreptococcaceae bacterium AS15]|nr:PF03235 family protein [Peptostreptococcaceae bacterium AS15]